eukprot:2558194-Pleurochrysis_carterae.AAC.8
MAYKRGLTVVLCALLRFLPGKALCPHRLAIAFGHRTSSTPSCRDDDFQYYILILRGVQYKSWFSHSCIMATGTT